MDMGRLFRASQIARASVILAVAIAASATVLVASVSLSALVRIEAAPWALPLAALAAAAFADFAVWYLRASVAVRVEAVRPPERGPDAASKAAAAAGGGVAWTTVAMAPIAVALLLLLLAAASYGLLSGGVGLTLGLAEVVVPALAYLVVRGKIVVAAIGLADRAFLPSLPGCSVADGEIAIDFKVRNLVSPGAPTTVRLKLSELTDVRGLGFVETQVFLRAATVGLPAGALRSGYDFARFLAGKIPRPTFYQRISSIGRTLVLAGPDLLYAITVSAPDADRVLEAFGKSRAG